jgi:hypothetical protein
MGCVSLVGDVQAKVRMPRCRKERGAVVTRKAEGADHVRDRHGTSMRVRLTMLGAWTILFRSIGARNDDDMVARRAAGRRE